MRRVDAVIARFNQFNYVGALLGAVVTGAIGGASLRLGFTLPALVVLGMIPLARHFAPRAHDEGGGIASPATPPPSSWG